MVFGPSGVGKSSLVQAGLLPRLYAAEEHAVAVVQLGLDPWQLLGAGLLRAQQFGNRQRPGELAYAIDQDAVDREVDRLRSHGFGPVARSLRNQGRQLIVVVDQFEQLLSDGALLESDLLDLLLPAPEATDSSVRLVHTLRADFLPALLLVPRAADRLDQRLYPVSPLTADQTRAAVLGPAAAVEVNFEDGLVEQLVRDAAAGSLPLLQFTLTRLWTTQRHRTLTYAGYHEMGGVAGALDRFAEQQLAVLPEAVAKVIDRVLLRLVRTARSDPELATRERVFKSSVSPDEWTVLQHLADARLVVTDEHKYGGAYAELAHEALIASWRRLNDLVRDNADFLGWHPP